VVVVSGVNLTGIDFGDAGWIQRAWWGEGCGVGRVTPAHWGRDCAPSSEKRFFT